MNLFRELVKSNKSLTDKLFDEVADMDIYSELSGLDIEIGKPVSSPLRDDDTQASFSLFIPTRVKNIRPEEVWWRDFARGSGNIFKFIKEYAKFQYDLDLDTIKQIVQFVDDELELGIFDKSNKKDRVKRVIDYEAARESKEILFKSRPYTRMDLYWWIRYGIDEELLKDHDVRSVLHLLGEDYTIKYTFGSYELAYAYVIKDKVKIYCPDSLSFKWRNTCPVEYVIGAEQCDRNDVMIITKSMKDILVFKSFIYCDAISPQAEGAALPPDIIKKIKTRYREVFVVMDYDETGVKAAELLEDHGFKVRWVSQEQVLVNGKLKILDKDISDYVKNNGIEAGFKRMRNMFSELSPSQFRTYRVTDMLTLQKQLSK